MSQLKNHTQISQTFFTFLAALSAASALPSAVLVQGPGAKTTLVGPDGGAISAAAPGGQIISEHHHGVVAHVAHAAHASPQIIAAVLVEPAASYGVPAASHGVPLGSYGVPVASHGLVHAVESGHYVHDHSEALYDDGSYKPHLY